jgi:hypothetical protein
MKLQQLSPALLLVASLGLIAAQEFEYAQYNIDREPNDSLPLAGRVNDIEYIYPPFLSLDACRASCNAASTCIGFAYGKTSVSCVAAGLERTTDNKVCLCCDYSVIHPNAYTAPNIQCVTLAAGEFANGIDAANKIVAWK